MGGEGHDDFECMSGGVDHYSSVKERYRIAKAKDFTKNNQIKDEQRVLLRDQDRIM